MLRVKPGPARVSLEDFSEPGWVWGRVSVRLENSETGAHQEIVAQTLVRSDDDPTHPELRRRALDQAATTLQEAARLLEIESRKD